MVHIVCEADASRARRKRILTNSNAQCLEPELGLEAKSKLVQVALRVIGAHMSDALPTAAPTIAAWCGGCSCAEVNDRHSARGSRLLQQQQPSQPPAAGIEKGGLYASTYSTYYRY
jgi:hypothetical protein